MDLEGLLVTLRSFLSGLAERSPEAFAELRRIEIDLDAQGVVELRTDVGAGLSVSRLGQGPVPTVEPEPTADVDVAVAAGWLDIPQSRWCHESVDTDCLLQVLAEASLTDAPGSHQLREAFDLLSIDARKLVHELKRTRPTGRGANGPRRTTGRLALVIYRILRARPERSDLTVTPIEMLRSLLQEDEGPAAEALGALGVSPPTARAILGVPQARPVEGGAMWPPAPHPRQYSWPDGNRGPLPHVQAPPPSPDTKPSSFVWTSPAGHELELSAARNGPITLRARAGGEAAVDLDARTAEMLARHLMDFHAQLEAERWEPIFHAEANGLPKPPPPTDYS